MMGAANVFCFDQSLQIFLTKSHCVPITRIGVLGA